MAEYPKDWSAVRLGDVFDIGSSKRVFQHQWRRSGIPFYRARDIVGFLDGEDAIGGLFIAPSLYEEFKKTYGVPGIDDLLVTAVGTLGKIYRVTDHHPFYFKDGNIIWLKTKGLADSRYIQYLFVSGLLDDQIFDTAGGSTVGTYTITRANNTIVILPTLPEQHRIADALSSIDELIDNLARRIEKKYRVKQGVLQELLSGKKRLSGVIGAWKTSRLADVAEFSTTSISSSRVDLTWYVGTDNMLPDGGGVAPNVASVPYANIREYGIDDILISNIRPYLKKIWLSDRHGGCSSDVLVVRGNPDSVTPKFLYFVLSDEKFFKFVMANAIGTKMPRGDKQVIMTYEFQVPPLSEQEAISTALEHMDAEIATLEAKRTKYERIKQGMMHDLLTGKVRI